MDELRVWAEELEEEHRLRLTWAWVKPDTTDQQAERERIRTRLQDEPGVLSLNAEDEGIIVQIDPSQITRPELASLVREALGASKPQPVDQPRVRVFAEDFNDRQLRLSWRFEGPDVERDESEDARRVTSWLAIQPAVKSARLDPRGVLVDYEPERADRRRFGDVARHALAIEEDLRTRAESLARRAPTYGNLAQRIARDERLSPLPSAARQAIGPRDPRAAGAQAALRFIPGATLIRRVQTVLPVIQELSSWSRNAPPELVDEHLAAVGLDRDTLEADNATAHEVVSFAREIASEKASEYASRASKSALSALESGRAWLETRLEQGRTDNSDDQEKDPTSRDNPTL